ncbi:hypothetical protein HELRODRAFT_106899 [Helobdella robusta]|uniref:BD-FAE-like domain-containing protein n=1 Tax=Helobdella robusta TaxID=6412 RepID=T1EE58_HELRO|nr:hypothetical protein HELRODRAFT_106899 [Helobdella robusta]ESN98651.1 hypothetical protein HELRODRAFT_106899 [Helobdella robusta]
MLRKMFRVALAATSTVLFIPYAIAFVAELIYGKPSKSHNRFLRALNPKRVYAFNYSLIRELKYFKYIKLYFAWTDFYRNETIDRLIKDIEYGQNRNSLDVYKGRSRYTSTNNTEPLKPVIIYLYGGGWSSGDKNIYGLLCSNLASLFNCIVVCPNYTLYPRGFVDDMVQDVSDVLQWVQNNAIIYGGDKNRVVMIGHSAGVHLATLTIGELCRKYLDNNPEYLEETNFPTVHGLAGVYDIKEHYEYQTLNGIENFSNMSRVMYDNLQQFHIFSPILVLSSLPEHVRLPPMHLYHGTCDNTVPVNSSLNFGAALSLRKDKTVQVRLLNGCDHVDIMMDLMERERVWFGTMMMEIKKGLDKYL